MNAVLERLRERTRPIHLRLEAGVRTLGFDANQAGFRRYLGKLLGFHAPLELDLASVRGLAELGLELDARAKTPALRADLAALGLDARALGGLAWCTYTPVLGDVPSALGALYVVEGATLGGQVLFHELSTRLPETARVASRYLRVYGDQTGARWQSFVRTLGALEGDLSLKAAEETAVATFEAFETWLFARTESGLETRPRSFA